MAQRNGTLSYGLEKLTLNLAIAGGGKACKFILELLQKEPFSYMDINLVGVCDIDPGAQGLRLAREMGIYTTDNFQDLFKIKDLDGIIELTASKDLLLELIRLRPKGMSVLEHNVSRLLSDLFIMGQKLKSAEQQVAIEKGASDFLIEQANERIVVVKPDFTILEANEAYLEAVAKFKHEVIGAHCYEITHGLSAPCTRSQPGLECPLTETLKTGKSAQVIHEHTLSGGDTIYCHMVTYPLKDQNGEITGVVEVWGDITQELSPRWEKRAKALKADLKKVIQEDRMISLGKLVASSVHEINNPIQGLLTFVDLMQDILREGEPGQEELKKFQEYLSLMSKELERCGNIVSGLLSFSRKSSMEHKDVDLNEVLNQVITLTRHRMELQDIQLEIDLYPRPILIHGDANQLQQCFLNLIFNAIEVMLEGGRLSIDTKLDSSGKNTLVTIEDTGCGIADEYLDHIFDPFFTTKEEGEGTGLGLSIVYGIVKTHGGIIEVKSREEEGSSFTLKFPIR